MTFWSLYTLIIILIYLAAFFIRNFLTYLTLRKSIRGKSTKLMLSLILSTIIYAIAFMQIFSSPWTTYLVGLNFIEALELKYLGFAFIMIALIVGLAALYEMKNSWRVGIKYEQKTDLVTSGIYSLSRNPYFLSYDLLFLGLFLIYPSLVFLILTLVLIAMFHFMIMEEEAYLEKVQGENYINYKKKVSRYLSYF
jgi:protein-S-isoprenylcysteine O-methyltransferase Ste14